MPEITVMHPRDKREPDVVLVVADTVDDQVLAWIQTIRHASDAPIAVVADADAHSAASALEAGASGIVPRAMADRDRLAWTIQEVYRGASVSLRGLKERSEPVHQVDSPVAALSERDREVLRLLAEGCDTGEIARKLAYSEPTIRNVIQRLFEQLKARNRPHAVAMAIRQGII